MITGKPTQVGVLYNTRLNQILNQITLTVLGFPAPIYLYYGSRVYRFPVTTVLGLSVPYLLNYTVLVPSCFFTNRKKK